MPGFVFYDGPSLIDKSPIVGIVTLNTKNEKTGNLAQTWIIRKNVHPFSAVSTGKDAAVCGDCPLRGIVSRGKNTERSCYVGMHTVGQIYKAYKSGVYPRLSPPHKYVFGSAGLRYGSYGDPVAIPMKAWGVLKKYCGGKAYPGYTHQWQNKKFSKWSKCIMASTHNEMENNKAHSMGWRTYRTIDNVNSMLGNEIVCPASREDEGKKTCDVCGACDGRNGMGDTRKNIAIVVHGSIGKPEYLLEIIKHGN
jgi:hypothetical protein